MRDGLCCGVGRVPPYLLTCVFKGCCLPDLNAPAIPSSPAGQTSSLLQPGRNCWRLERAEKASVLVDGACYFARLEQALRSARRSILIVGWDFDGRITLRHGTDGSPALGDLLRSLVETCLELEVRILVWSIATLHAPGEALPLIVGAAWQDHARIHLRLDREHPIYGAHHQKIVCIDDSLSFAGGIDLTVQRWDTSRHTADDAMRVTPEGSSYGPVHDLQMVVDGAAARALADLARMRWRDATGEELKPIQATSSLWPDDLEPDFSGASVGIARTAAPWGHKPPIQEIAGLTIDMLAAAHHSIYIEAQYFVSFAVGDLLARHLAREDGPDVVVVTSRTLPGTFERFVMGTNRDRLLRRIKRADRFDRFRVFHPVVSGEEDECEVLIHAKLIVVDDHLLRVGSSNLNNRSVGLDTECDLTIEASSDHERRNIARLRDRLLGEHLDISPEEVARAIAAEGSLARAVDALNRRERGLRAFEALRSRGPARPIVGTRLLDPKKPFEPLWFLRKKRRKSSQAFSGQTG